MLKLQEKIKGLLGVEKAMLIYWGITFLLILVLNTSLDNFYRLLIDRGAILIGLGIFWYIHKMFPNKITVLLRVVYQMGLLAYWYTDTYNFNQLFPNLDHYFASFEQILFNGQPSIEFCENVKGLFWSEAFNLGYLSYYPMIVTLVIFTFLKHYDRFYKSTFIIMASFFLFYLIYIALPVTGPQFYFQAIGLDVAEKGFFPSVGDYFHYHQDLLPSFDTRGFFYTLVEATQKSGECPTAAFPSSHVGMSTIIMILAYKTSKRLMLFFLPFYLLLCVSTVYIQAHYLIDSIAGLITAFILYELTHKLYYTKFFHQSHRRQNK